MVVEGGTDQGLVVIWVAIRGDGVALLVLVVGSLIIKISSKKVKKIKEHTWAQETHRRHVSWAFFFVSFIVEVVVVVAVRSSYGWGWS